MRRIGLLIILISIPLTILLISKVSDLRKKASEETYVLMTTRLTNDAAYQRKPDVFENQIVWEDWSFRNADIRGVEINTDTLQWQVLNIPERDDGDWSPRVGQRGVVWWGGSYNPRDEGEIFFWEEGGVVRKLDTNPAEQWDPDIWDNLIVWEDWRADNPDIYAFDLNTDREAATSTLPSYQERPRIWEKIIIWHDYYQNAIYYFDLKTKEEGFLDYQSYLFSQTNQDIADYIAVWQDDRSGNWDIYGYNFRTRQPFAVYAASGNQTNPRVSKNYVVWEDDSRGNKDIRGIDLSTGEVFDIANTIKDEVTPAIDGQLVVWEEDPEGVSDIVLAKLRPQRPESPISFLQSLAVQFANSSLLLTWSVNQSLIQNLSSLRLSLATPEGEVVGTVDLATNSSTYTFANLQNGQRYISTLEALGSTGKVLQSLSVEEVPRCRLEDLNGNREIDIFDLVMVARRFGSDRGGENFDPVVDLDKDGDIDLFDLVRVARVWGQGC